jgi:hypothetical protein
MNDGLVVNGDYTINTLGSILAEAVGDGIILCASGDEAYLQLVSSGSALVSCATSSMNLEEDWISLSTGEMGSIELVAGPVGICPRMQVGPDSITLKVGPPGIGASLEMTATEITLKVGQVSLSLSELGIKENILALATREVNAMGHTLRAADTSLGVGITGIAESGPTKQEDFDVAMTQKTAMQQITVSGIRTVSAGIEMKE